MAKPDVPTLTKRCEAAKAVKEDWRALLTDAYEYCLPQRNLFKTDAFSTQGQKKVDRVFSSTAQVGLIRFANRIQSDMMPPFHKWVTLQAGPMVPEENVTAVNELLEKITELLFAVIQGSNFDTANNEVLLELGVGTGVMLVLEGDLEMPVVYVPVPIGLCALEEGPWGAIIGVYIDHRVRIDQIEATWKDAKNIPAQLRQNAENDPTAEHEFIGAIYQDPDNETIWHYDVIEPDEKVKIVERQFNWRPVVVPRWIKVAGEVFGRGPAVQALPDIKTENKVTELILKNAAMAISGVYTGVRDGVLNPYGVRFKPGTVIPVASNGGTRGPSLLPLQRSGDFNVAELVLEKLVMNIKNVLLDNRLPAESGAVRSATEIIARLRELAADIGSPFGRLMREYIVPLVQSTLAIMAKRGMLPEVKVDGLAVQAAVISPLAQEQNLNEVQQIVQWLSLLGAIGPELVPTAAKVEKLGQHLGEKLGVPADLIRDEEEAQGVQLAASMLMQRQLAAQGGIGTGSAGGAIGTGQEQLPLAA